MGAGLAMSGAPDRDSEPCPFSAAAAVPAARRRRFKLGENGFQRVEPWRERAAGIVDRFPQMPCHRRRLFVG
jgi:hypothetical protein